jgi:hypothetical protein
MISSLEEFTKHKDFHCLNQKINEQSKLQEPEINHHTPNLIYHHQKEKNSKNQNPII